MRSVRSRKPARGRNTPKRRTPNARTRVQQVSESFGKRKPQRNDIFSRAFRAAREKLSFRRPVLILTAWLIGATIIGALFVGGQISRTVKSVNGALSAVLDKAGFGIAEVHLAGNVRTPSSTILAALGLEPGQSIFAADLPAARARLMLLPWVADAEVRRRYPDSISVSLVEKLPFALWAHEGRISVVERPGGVITDQGLEEFVKLPRIAGAGAPKHAAEIVDAVALHRAVRARVKVIERVSDRRWNLNLDNGVVVKLPETGWQEQLDVLEQLIVDKGILERDIKEIDLRSPQNYFFRLRDNAGQKPKTGEHAA